MDEVERCLEIDFKGAKVTVVDADGVGACGAEDVEEAIELGGGVDFDEDVKGESAGARGKIAEVGVGQGGDDEKDGIGAMGAGLDDLLLVDHEILAQAGDFDGGGGEVEIAEAALKEGLVGEDGESRGSAGLQARSEPARIEGCADESFGGRGFFDLRDDRGRLERLAAESRGPSARLMRGSEAFELGSRHTHFCRGHCGPGRSEDGVQMGAHALARV